MFVFFQKMSMLLVINIIASKVAQTNTYPPEPMPIKTRQTMKTTKAFGKIIIHVASTTRMLPPFHTILLPKLSEETPPTIKAANIPTQKDDWAMDNKMESSQTRSY